VKYQIQLTEKQLEAIKIIKITRKVIFFEDTREVCIDLDTKTYIDFELFNSLEMMQLLMWKRNIGNNQHEFKLNINQLQRVKNINLN